MLSEENLGGRAAIRRTELFWRNEASDTGADGGESACAVEAFLLFPFPSSWARLLRAGQFVLYGIHGELHVKPQSN